MTDRYPHLFTPIELRRRTARNRIMRASTTSQLAERNRVTDRMVGFYRTIARGGVGAIVTEAMGVHPGSAGIAVSGQSSGGVSLSIYDRNVIGGLRTLADAVHEEDVLLIGQINHPGRQHLGTAVPLMWAPSAIACPRSGGVPHEMTTAEVEEMIACYIEGAVNLVEAGFDGIELHGAQGHLGQQFMSPYSNQRGDRFGGSLDKRMTFARTILRGVRERVGDDIVIGYRMAVAEFVPGGLTIEDAVTVARRLVEEKLVDYLSLSQGTFATLDRAISDRHFAPGYFVDIQSPVKEAVTGVPVIGCTRIRTPDLAERIIAEGKADMIAVSRAITADPEWPAKAREGRANRIRYCIGCNQCWNPGGPIVCAVNPRVGRESMFEGAPEPMQRLRVVVVGGGPAGMEAARSAASRGHDVVLFERGQQLGGKLQHAAEVPSFREHSDALAFLIGEVQRQQVAVHTGVDADVRTVMAHSPDAVIVATGATAGAPPVPGDGSVPVLHSDAALPPLPAGDGRIVVMDEDGHYWAAAAAEKAAIDRRVVFVTRFFEPLRELPAASRAPTLRALDLKGVDMRPAKYVHRVEEGRVVLRHFFSEREEVLDDCAAVVWIGHQRANDSIAQALRDTGRVDVHVIGDALAPRRMIAAIREGHDVGQRI